MIYAHFSPKKNYDVKQGFGVYGWLGIVALATFMMVVMDLVFSCEQEILWSVEQTLKHLMA